MKILIVDDEPGVASSLAQWLETQGWGTPGTAATAEEGIHWINENGGIDVLVSNVYMQPVDGFTLHETILPHFPELKTVFLTAYDVSEYASRVGEAAVLIKPATGGALDAAIRGLFDPKPAKPVAVPVVARVAGEASSTPQAATPSAAPKTVEAQPAAPSTPAVARAAVAAAPKAVAATPAPKAAVASAAPKAAVPASAPKAATPQAATAAPRGASASPKPVPAAAKEAPSSGEVELAPDEFVGQTLGNYHVEARVGQGHSGGIYRATQTNIGRQVRFYILDPQRAQDSEAVQSFIANASVKANVSHPYILAVYEAGQAAGVYFYSCEYIPCRSVSQIIDAGQFLDENTALQTMKIAAETMAYFEQNKIAHNLVSENNILIASNNKPRMANIAAFRPPEGVTQEREMAELGRVIAAALPEKSQALGLRAFAAGLSNGALQFPTWQALVEAIVSMEPKVAPEDAYKLDAQERAAIRMVEEARKRQRRNMITTTAVSLALLGTLLGVAYYLFTTFFGGGAKDFKNMLEIPAGEFTYQDGQKVNLPTFYIDEYEVTISQYAKFLEYLEKHPDEEVKFAHPDQPPGKPHIPVGWAEEAGNPGYYVRAKRWRKYQGAPLDVNSPVFGVDWYDAYAYAKWKGHRLPTEQEWEKAARGTQGFTYPWGMEADPKRANTGSDYIPDPSRGGEIDGWDRASPVDAVKKDISPFKVFGMSGNVSEWTGTWIDDPKWKGLKLPVIRGGNWKNKDDYTITRRVTIVPADKSGEELGFRTVSDTAPVVEKK